QTHQAFWNACDVKPIQGNLGVESALLLAPGNAEKSLIWRRIAADDENSMPPLGRNHVDMESAELIREWINSFDECRSVVGPLAGVYNFQISDNSLLSNEYGVPLLVNSETEIGTSWQILPALENFYHIKNSTGNNAFLHFENMVLNVGNIQPVWWSAHWDLIAEQDYFLIRNRWFSDYFLQIEDNAVLLA